MPRIVAMAAHTAAGGLAETVAAVSGRTRHFQPADYPIAGLCHTLVARTSVARGRPAETLLLDVLSQVMPHATGRVGLVVATSTGNLAGVFERNHRAEIDGGDATEPRAGRDGPTLAADTRFGFTGPVTTLSVACVSGTVAFTIAEGWLADGLCDQVVVAGVDAACPFVHAGFAGLGALAAELPHPFTEQRDGLVLGEGAAAILLGSQGEMAVVGTGLSSDAKHATAPDREAGGARRAIRAALNRAGRQGSEVDQISPHATGTRFNDAMEQVALEALGLHAPLQFVKRSIGHTLGAAGLIEATVALASFPGQTVLSMSSAFGGMNAAVVFGPGLVAALKRFEVHVRPLLDELPTLDELGAPARMVRADRYVQYGVRAILAEHRRSPLPTDTALVLASVSNCDRIDRRYHERLVREGPAHVSRRAFADTIPSAPVAAASLLLGLQGPQLAFVDGQERAEQEAMRLVRYGRASTALALHLEVPVSGPATVFCRRYERCLHIGDRLH